MLEPGDGAGHLCRGKDQLVVNFIRQYKDVPRQGPTHDLHELAVGIDRARGIAGRVEDQQPGLVRGLFLKHEGRDLEIAFRPGMHGHGHAARQLHHVGIAQPVGRGNQHLVAGVDGGLHEIVEAVLAARADDNGFHGHGRAVVPFKVAARGLAQIGNAGHGGVAAEIGVNGALGRVADMPGRGEIRFAHGQAGHVHALRLELQGPAVDTEGQRRFDAAQAFGNLHGGLLRRAAWH